MIVCSKRVFLNVITQMYSADVLLNANYYIGDPNQSKKTFVNNEVGIDTGSGQIVRRNRKVTDKDEIETAMGPYHICSDTCLDPTPFIVQFVMGSQSSDDPVGDYIKYLNFPDTLWNVYSFLFRKQLEGNGLQILMFEDHKQLWKFGHLICQYLSYNFGCDITFVDKAVVNVCEGYTEYKGNKQVAMKLIKDLNDYSTIESFAESVTQSSSRGNMTNIETYLSGLSFNDLMYLYNLLYPEAPLPPGNYTIDQIKGIIIGRVGDSIQFNPRAVMKDDESFNNLLIHNWQSVLDEFENATVEEVFGEDEYPGDDSGLF